MPNWANNILIVQGNDEDIESFAEAVKGNKDEEGKVLPLSFETICPTPQDLIETTCPVCKKEVAMANQVRHGYTDWYDFRLKEWGTKWELLAETEVKRSKGSIMYSFQTAWSPPAQIVMKLGKRYPSLKFELRYCEQGMEFAGVFTVKDKVTKDIAYTKKSNPKKYKEMFLDMGEGSG